MADKNSEQTVAVHLFSLLDESNKTDKELEIALKLKPKTVSNWRRGRSHGYMRHLPEIASFFAVSPAYLWEGKNSMQKELSSEEWELISAYRALSHLDVKKRKAVRDLFRKITDLYSK